ncbi:MAG: mechanosensitive ion channel domain-containing protein [Planctomycetota bacterium]
MATETGLGVASEVGKAMKSVIGPNATSFIEASVIPKLWPACIGLAVLFIGYFVARYVSRIVSRPIQDRIDETLGRFIGTMIFYSIMAGLVASVAGTLGAQLGGLTAIVAAAGFAVGLAFQGTLSNFAAGVLMIVFRPFKVGDVVTVAGVTGKVNEIDLFTTTLDTPDNRRLIIPNSSISGTTIENTSFHAHRRVEVVVGVDYDANLDGTRQALQMAVEMFAQQTVQGEGRGNQIVLSNLADSAVEWKVRMWVNTADYWALSEALTAEVKRQLDAAKIGIPYPQLDVHMTRVDGGEAMGLSRPRMRPPRRSDAVA